MSPNDLAFPASTDTAALLQRVRERAGPETMTVVFSTYQSIDVITEAQQQGLGDFDLVVCDEAHRTTGAFKDAGDQSVFTRIHDDAQVRARRRLYMTATPRVYGDQTKAKAAQHDVVLASMDDEATYGPVFHELGFGDAVAQSLLTDYRVIILAVNEDAVSGAFQRQLAADGADLALNDVARIVGCWHGLSKRGPQFAGDQVAMQRAVAFSSTIKASKAFAEIFPRIANEAFENRRDANAVKIETDHVDGTNNVKVRSEALAWLEARPGQGVCRVLSNAKCLTEGVDVPALDAVLFLQPRRSIVDVVQAVGRVMRLAPGKDYGYVILPVAVPAGVSPEEALRDNKAYQVVWQVLQALRSHDERLAAEINKIDINGASKMVQVIGVGLAGGDDPTEPGITTTATELTPTQLQLPDLAAWRDALYARIVERVGDRRYMEHWAEDIGRIALAQQARIRGLLDSPEQNPRAVARFGEFLTALQHNLNDAVTRDRRDRDALATSDHSSRLRSAVRWSRVQRSESSLAGDAGHDGCPRRRRDRRRDRDARRLLRAHPHPGRRDRFRRRPPASYHGPLRAVLQEGAARCRGGARHRLHANPDRRLHQPLGERSADPPLRRRHALRRGRACARPVHGDRHLHRPVAPEWADPCRRARTQIRLGTARQRDHAARLLHRRNQH